MALSAFDDRSAPPAEADLEKVLGKSATLWRDLLGRLSEHFGPITAEWGFASKSTGWGLRLKTAKRTVLYMTPCRGYFLASFALGEKAVAAAHASNLPAPVLAAIDAARKYVEGRGVRLEVRKAADVRAVETLAMVKMAN